MTSVQIADLLDESNCSGCYAELSVIQRLKLSLLDRVGKLQSVYSFVQRSGITDPVQIAALNELVLSAHEHGWWDKCDLIYPFVGGTDVAHAQNLKSSSFTITWNGAVTHDANGITGDGATGYGDTSYILSTSGQFSITNCHVAVYRRTFGSINSKYYCGAASGGPLLLLQRGTSNTIFRTAINDLNLVSMTATSALGFLSVAKIDSLRRRYYDASGEVTANPNVSLTAPTVSLFLLGRNNSGVAADFLDSNLSGLTLGSGITFSEYQLMATDWQTFQAALGRQV